MYIPFCTFVEQAKPVSADDMRQRDPEQNADDLADDSGYTQYGNAADQAALSLSHKASFLNHRMKSRTLYHK